MYERGEEGKGDRSNALRGVYERHLGINDRGICWCLCDTGHRSGTEKLGRGSVRGLQLFRYKHIPMAFINRLPSTITVF